MFVKAGDGREKKYAVDLLFTIGNLLWSIIQFSTTSQ